jgi:hypothetical protein
VAEYIWPLSNSITPDEMNTSFGPRIDMDRWDFHDGIDLPAPRGTEIHAMHAGVAHHVGPGGTGGYSSRHVVIRIDDTTEGPIYHVYLHLETIDQAVVTNASIAQGQILGTVGDDDATYCHLHMEVRKGTSKQIGSVHPLNYLPYSDTANFDFRPSMAARFNRLDGFMAARLLFDASSKLQGDLRRVEVDLQRGTQLLTTRIVDFDDKSTVVEGKGDQHIYVDDIGIEGYQQSNMVKHCRTDLAYGILVRGMPSQCDAFVARVIDIGGNVVTSEMIAVPNQAATDEFVDFEDEQLPPVGWTKVTSSSGSGTTVSINASAAHAGARGMLCTDESKTEVSPQRAAIEYALPAGRFEWRAQAWFNVAELELAPRQAVYLLHFLSGDSLSVAARIYNDMGTLRAGLVAKQPDGTRKTKLGPSVTPLGRWDKWRLELLRVATRETTAILYLNERGRMKEQARLNWDSTEHEPQSLRVGIGFSSVGAAATALVDEVWLTETELSL